MMMVRGVRGATTVIENDALLIESKTETLVRTMVQENQIDPAQVAQVLITATNDIDAGFPAKALRNLEGWNYVPVMCAQEIPVKGSLSRCIRIMMTINTDIEQMNIKHVFLEDAVSLRPDLINKGK